MTSPLFAPFPYFGGKRTVAADVWARLGSPKQYIEPFCGSAAILLAAPRPASLEVVCDANGFIANFWRATKMQPEAVAVEADYPVSHIDLGARHRWLSDQRARIGEALLDPTWPGDARVAGWWLWGQCAWIGSGWCDWDRGEQRPRGSGQGFERVPFHSSTGQVIIANERAASANWDQKPRADAGTGVQAAGQIPFTGNAGGVASPGASGQIPHVGNPGRGVSASQADGKIPHVGNPGRGVSAPGGAHADGQIPFVSSVGMGVLARPSGDDADADIDAPPTLWTSAGRTARRWLLTLAARLERVRVIHGEWTRCLNHHYGGDGPSTAIFFDPPYKAFEKLYGVAAPVADAVAAGCAEHPELSIALCGHRGDYTLPGWEAVEWSRGKLTYGGAETTAEECIWYSPGCQPALARQPSLFGGL